MSMQPLVPIREIVSQIIKTAIPPHSWGKTFAELDRQGRIDNKTMLACLLEALKRIEYLEGEVGKLNGQPTPSQTL